MGLVGVYIVIIIVCTCFKYLNCIFISNAYPHVLYNSWSPRTIPNSFICLSDAKPRQEKGIEYPPAQANSLNPSPDQKNDSHDELLDIMNADDDDDNTAADGGDTIELKELNFDINEPHPTYSEDEIADVDVSDDEADKGPNAAEALRAQVAEERDGRSSSSSGSSGSESSGSDSGSGSSSSDSDSSDADSVTSVWKQSIKEEIIWIQHSFICVSIILYYF